MHTKTVIKDNSSKTAYKQLIILGALAAAISFLPQIFGMIFWNYPFFNSISASANSYGTSNILPFVLGAMAVYFFAYEGYDRTDRILTLIMALGAFGVAMFQCKGGPMQGAEASIFALSKDTANLIHSVSAISLFAAMIYWVRFQFVKSSTLDPTPNKTKRNRLYKICGNTAFFSLLGFGLITLGPLKGFAPNIWILEVLILLPLSVAILCKGRAFLKD